MHSELLVSFIPQLWLRDGYSDKAFSARERVTPTGQGLWASGRKQFSMSSAACLALAVWTPVPHFILYTKGWKVFTSPPSLDVFFGGYSLPLATESQRFLVYKCMSIWHKLHFRWREYTIVIISIFICSLRYIYKKCMNHSHTFLEVMYSYLLLYALRFLFWR